MADYPLLTARVVLLCLVPDSGHVIPLVRIGRLLANAGARVTLICSEELAHLARDHVAEVVVFGSVRPQAYQQALVRITAASEVARRVWLNRWFEERYTEPVQEAVLRQLDVILSLVQSARPSLLIADDHLFRGVARWVAEHCGCPLVLNYSAGTNYRCIRRKPWLNRTRCQEQSIAVAAKIVPKLLRMQERLLTPGFRRHRQARFSYLEHEWQRIDSELHSSDADVPHIAAGLIELENRYLRDRFEVNRELIAFPSTPPLESGPLPAELEQWLTSGGPVIFICFGTMAPGQLPVAVRLVDACVARGLRVLWAAPSAPASLSRWPAAVVRWEPWVPQVTLLAREEVAGFVSHAGGGSVQEALWFGRPLICVPLTWDQPWNAWVAQQLGFAKVLNKQRFTAQELDQAVDALLAGELAATARRYQQEMREATDQNRIVAFLAGCTAPLHAMLMKGDDRNPASVRRR